MSIENVSVRRVLAYAAGIGDTSAAVFDDLGEIVAPPAFCVALEWPAISQPAARELLGAERAERAARRPREPGLPLPPRDPARHAARDARHRYRAARDARGRGRDAARGHVPTSTVPW